MEESAQRIRTAQLEDQVTDLKEQLTEKDEALTKAKTEVKELTAVANMANLDLNETAVSLMVSAQKAKQVHAEMIRGVKYLVVPLEKGEVTQINGVPMDY